MPDIGHSIWTSRRSIVGHCEAMSANRRFPAPWSIEETGTGSAFVVKDSSGQNLAYVYYEEEAGRRSAAKMLTKDEAPRIEANFAKLSDLLRRRDLFGPRRNSATARVACFVGSVKHTPWPTTFCDRPRLAIVTRRRELR
jgi:hypothetical protein